MKLRIRGNTLRLRLTRAEVERLGGSAGCVAESVRFGPEASLNYSIKRGDVRALRAEFHAGSLHVTAPHAVVAAWAKSDEVGFECEQSTGDGHILRILVEKDWNCLTSRPGEEDVDTFPNPHTSC